MERVTYRDRKVEARSSFSSFSSWLYKDPGQTPYVREGVSTFLFESLMYPKREDVYVDPEVGFVDRSTGRAYEDVFQRAIDHYSSDNVVRSRFESEREGFHRAKGMVEELSSREGTLPPFVIASPPGQVYDSGGHTKSVTFLGIPEGYDDRGNASYSLYSIPSSRLEVSEHWDLVSSVSNVSLSAELVNYAISSLDDRSIVAFPALVENLTSSLEKISYTLGYDGWEEVEHLVGVSDLQEDARDETQARREVLISWFEEKIKDYVLKDKGREDFDILDHCMNLVFSAEYGGFFLDEKYSDHSEVEKYLESVVKSAFDSRSVGEKDPNLFHDVRGELYFWVMMNEKARDSFEGKPCGAGPGSSLFGESSYKDSFSSPINNLINDDGRNVLNMNETTSLSSGEKQCYECPVCVDPKGQVYKVGEYLVCDKEPGSHKVRA